MRSKKLLLFVFLIYSCVPLSIKYANSTFKPFIFNDIQYAIVGHNYKNIGWTQSIPGRPIKKITSTIYEVKFNLVINNDLFWHDPFIIKVDYPDDYSEVILFNEEREKLYNGIYNYSFQVTAKQKIKIFLGLGYYDENNVLIIDHNNPFKYRAITLN